MEAVTGMEAEMQAEMEAVIGMGDETAGTEAEMEAETEAGGMRRKRMVDAVPTASVNAMTDGVVMIAVMIALLSLGEGWIQSRGGVSLTMESDVGTCVAVAGEVKNVAHRETFAEAIGIVA